VGDFILKPILFALLLLSATPIAAIEYAPWGKDAQLAQKSIPSQPAKPISTPIVGAVAEKMIAFHREVISPCDGPRSHYEPSSSKYTLDAMRKYGFLNGFLKGCDRLMRENNDPWYYPKTIDRYGKISKHDPA